MPVYVPGTCGEGTWQVGYGRLSPKRDGKLRVLRTLPHPICRDHLRGSQAWISFVRAKHTMYVEYCTAVLQSNQLTGLDAV